MTTTRTILLQYKLSPEELDYLDKQFPEGAFAGTRYGGPQMDIVVN